MGMLEEARRKDLYKEFQQMTLGEELGFETDSFDAVISVGVFTTGHAPAHAFDELARITKPGGFIVFSLRVDLYEEDGFKEYQAGLEEAGKWKLAELRNPTIRCQRESPMWSTVFGPTRSLPKDILFSKASNLQGEIWKSPC